MKAKKLDDYYQFLNGIIELYKKFGFSLNYSKETDNLIIEEFKDTNVEWLKDSEVSLGVVERMFKE